MYDDYTVHNSQSILQYIITYSTVQYKYFMCYSPIQYFKIVITIYSHGSSHACTNIYITILELSHSLLQYFKLLHILKKINKHKQLSLRTYYNTFTEQFQLIFTPFLPENGEGKCFHDQWYTVFYSLKQVYLLPL